MTRKNDVAKTAQPRESLATKGTTNVPVRREPEFSLFAPTPFSLLRRFTDDFERMFENFSLLNGSPLFGQRFEFPALPEFPANFWTPSIEVSENKGQLKVRADLPGLNKDEINVEIGEDSLTISGERKRESKEEGEGYYKSERSYGSFYRNIPLPEGTNTQNAMATFENGVLEVKLQVPERKTKGRKLEITAPAETPKTKTAKA